MFNQSKIAFLEKILTEHERVLDRFKNGNINYSALISLKKSQRKISRYIDSIPENICGMTSIKKRIEDIALNITKISEKHNG